MTRYGMWMSETRWLPAVGGVACASRLGLRGLPEQATFLAPLLQPRAYAAGQCLSPAGPLHGIPEELAGASVFQIRLSHSNARLPATLPPLPWKPRETGDRFTSSSFRFLRAPV
ncbi:hypothetical protein AAFF_G00114430 [Aldrovandia affinis]|uniref:Uncharacterized protein n=1 Tax=Aldrovandia affinis TaxID=143900 RepID=A0AAD7RT36_9TELE|nr:hypothetical protein AAFF_G00114430 [Aldrovandia affinis]